MFELLYPSGIAPILPFPPLDKSLTQKVEMLPIIDENGIVKGQAARSECHTNNTLLHPVVHLYLINRNGDIFLQHRSATKETWPRRWDTSVGGHVSYGETIKEALFREAEEELGFSQFNPIYLGAHIYNCEFESEMVVTFAAVGDFNIKVRNAEVSGGRYWSRAEIEKKMGGRTFTPNFEDEYPRIINSLEALL